MIVDYSSNYWSLISLENTYNKVFDEVVRGKKLPNKYLYLGLVGASNWIEVVNTYEPGRNSKELVSKYFPIVDRLIRKQEDTESYDIISLGCGNGGDDKLMSQIICNDKQKKFNGSIVLFDISQSLLNIATRQLNNLKASMRRFSPTIHSVHCDFEDIVLAKNIIGRGGRARENRTALFHLLGLTIGNNDEFKLLEKISCVMSPGDYLLVEADLSAEDDESLEQKESQYKYETISRFLCSPIRVANRFKQYGSDFSFPIDELKVVHKNSNIKHPIPNTSRLERYHLYKTKDGVTNKRRCDYSNKYELAPLSEFLESLDDRISLRWVDRKFLHEENLLEHSCQKFILLRKGQSSKKELELDQQDISDINDAEGVQHDDNDRIDFA